MECDAAPTADPLRRRPGRRSRHAGARAHVNVLSRSVASASAATGPAAGYVNHPAGDERPDPPQPGRESAAAASTPGRPGSPASDATGVGARPPGRCGSDATSLLATQCRSARRTAARDPDRQADWRPTVRERAAPGANTRQWQPRWTISGGSEDALGCPSRKESRPQRSVDRCGRLRFRGQSRRRGPGHAIG